MVLFEPNSRINLWNVKTGIIEISSLCIYDIWKKIYLIFQFVFPILIFYVS